MFEQLKRAMQHVQLRDVLAVLAIVGIPLALMVF